MTAPIMLLDVGNSRVKWALVQTGEWLAEGVCMHDDAARLLGEWDRLTPPASVIASNVAGEERLGALSTYWRSRNVPLRCVAAGTECAGVRNLYERPSQLGSDRWAALVGAWARTRSACLVVSAGTAVTVDALNDSGEFMGGMILPGKRLMQRSLAAGTHALEDDAGRITDFPRNTADAIATGIAAALAGAVLAAHRRLAATGAESPPCIVTGGDAEWLAAQLQFGVIIAPKLVLEGLLAMSTGDAQK